MRKTLRPQEAKAPIVSIPPGIEFRHAIESAKAAGARVEDMTLYLTLRASSQLRRDPTLADEDIRYSEGGVMHFLGVLVVSAGVQSSRLDRNAIMI